MEPRQKKLLIRSAILVALLVVALLARAPVMNLVRGWRYDANITKAEEAYADHDLVGANQYAGAAMRLKPTDLDALRTLMELGVRIRSPDLSTIAVARFQHEEATLDDQIEVLELALVLGDLAFVNQLYDEIPREQRGDPRLQFCYADILDRTGKRLDAVELVNTLLDTPVGNEARYRLTRLLASLENNPVAYQRVRDLVVHLIETDASQALAAFRNLRLLPASERKLPGVGDLQGWVRGQPNTVATDHMLAAEVSLREADGALRGEIVEAIMKEFRDDNPLALARWLMTVGESKRIMELPRELLREEESFYTAYLQVLIDEGRIEETKEWIADPHLKLDPILIDAVRAGIAHAQGDEPMRVVNWQKAFKRAEFKGTYGSFFIMLRIAQRFRDPEMVRKISTSIAELPPRSLPATHQLDFLRHEFGDEVEYLQAFYQRLEASRPKDPLARHHLALIHIVMKQDLEKSVSVLKEIVEAHADLQTFRCALALGYHAAGRGEEALQLLNARKVDWNQGTSTFERAAYAFIQEHAGEARIASALRATLRWQELPGYLRNYLR